MKRNLLLLLCCLSLPASAIEVTLGQGSFSSTASLKGLMKADIDLDIVSLSVAQPATAIGQLPVLWSARLKLFQSGFVNQLTDFARQPVSTDIPFLGASADDLAASYTPVPVPTDYRIHGIDLNLRLDWPLVTSNDGYLHVGINSGVTLPFMKTRNMGQDANVFLDLLETTSTEIRSYKLGPAISASWALTPAIRLQGEWTVNIQRGTLDNDLLGAGIDIKGRYTQFDAGVRIQPQHWPRYLEWLQNGYLLAGYRSTRWDYDRASFSFRQAALTVPTELDMDFSKSSVYLGLGVSFR